MSPPNRDVSFKSFVASAFRAELEALLYFNRCQTRVWNSIVEAVERFGSPEIAADAQAERQRALIASRGV